MDDILASIRGHINERLNSPLFGAYALAWLFFNFKVPLMLFSGLDVHQKMYQIDMYLHADFDRVLYVYGWPLVIAAFYIFILPIPSTLVTAWTLLHQNVLASVQQKVLQRRIVTAEELAEKEKQWRDTHDAREKRLQELELTNEGLRNQRTRAEADLNDTMSQLKTAVELGKSIPELNQRISESSDRIIEMTTRVADLRAEINSQKTESEVMKHMLTNVANLVDESGIGDQVYYSLVQATANHSIVPEPIENLIAYLNQLRNARLNKAGVTASIFDSPSGDPAMGVFDNSKNPNIRIKDYINDGQIINFLRKYCDWSGSGTQLVESSIDRFKIFSDVVGAEGAAELYRLVNTASPDFDSMSDALKKGLRDLVEI